MQRLNDIKAKAINKAGNPSGIGAGGMNIPGMKIGTQIAPGAPTYEDIFWLIAKVIKCRSFLSECGLTGEQLAKATALIREIDEGK